MYETSQWIVSHTGTVDIRAGDEPRYCTPARIFLPQRTKEKRQPKDGDIEILSCQTSVTSTHVLNQRHSGRMKLPNVRLEHVSLPFDLGSL